MTGCFEILHILLHVLVAWWLCEDHPSVSVITCTQWTLCLLSFHPVPRLECQNMIALPCLGFEIRLHEGLHSGETVRHETSNWRGYDSTSARCSMSDSVNVLSSLPRLTKVFEEHAAD
ncbi:hypothetical protein GE09DRAFT_12445 [Coniochaeta sp. 2T2.1]|nr:hypothetical protein GE09DRAFT_12445 [Coniochaeta sp. 2T2.1]